jgi:hypothetical protein
MRALQLYFPFFIIILPLFLYSSCPAQTIPDSLLTKLNRAVNDSVKARALLDIGEAIEATSPQRSFDYYQQALLLSRKINWTVPSLCLNRLSRLQGC